METEEISGEWIIFLTKTLENPKIFLKKQKAAEDEQLVPGIKKAPYRTRFFFQV